MIVHLLSGQNLTLSVEPCEKVADVKKKVLTILNLCGGSLSLLHYGSILNDDSSLQDYSKARSECMRDRSFQ